jgi:hypothetical protein
LRRSRTGDGYWRKGCGAELKNASLIGRARACLPDEYKRRCRAVRCRCGYRQGRNLTVGKSIAPVDRELCSAAGFIHRLETLVNTCPQIAGSPEERRSAGTIYTAVRQARDSDDLSTIAAAKRPDGETIRHASVPADRKI